MIPDLTDVKHAKELGPFWFRIDAEEQRRRLGWRGRPEYRQRPLGQQGWWIVREPELSQDNNQDI